MNEELAKIIDNGTIEVNVPTPENWICSKKGCSTLFYHRHSTYANLCPIDPQELEQCDSCQ